MRSVYGRHIYLNLLCDNAGGGLLNIIDEDPSVSKYNQTTHCDPLVFLVIHLIHIHTFQRLFKRRWVNFFLKSSRNFNRSFLKLNHFHPSVSSSWVSLFIGNIRLFPTNGALYGPIYGPWSMNGEIRPLGTDDEPGRWKCKTSREFTHNFGGI